ncbi:hypothetical protein [Consotaella aegiceratis]|uniref:hypothetical protein n=1 Tax=Consotaella aegiceratis TaxID=3097961 RepID=UPI002F420FA3
MLLLIGAGIGWFIESETPYAATWFAENGPVEWPQAVVVGLAAVVFAVCAWRSPGPLGTWCIPIAYLLACAIVREMPACESHFYDGGACIERSWKTVLVTTGGAIMLVGFFLRRHNLMAMIKPRWSFVFWPLGIAFLLLIVAEVGEKFGHEGIEEMLEFSAYIHAFCFSVWVFGQTRRPQPTGRSERSHVPFGRPIV